MDGIGPSVHPPVLSERRGTIVEKPDATLEAIYAMLKPSQENECVYSIPPTGI